MCRIKFTKDTSLGEEKRAPPFQAKYIKWTFKSCRRVDDTFSYEDRTNSMYVNSFKAPEVFFTCLGFYISRMLINLPFSKTIMFTHGHFLKYSKTRKTS